MRGMYFIINEDTNERVQSATLDLSEAATELREVHPGDVLIINNGSSATEVEFTERLLACRSCLSTEARLYDLHSRRLAQMFEELTGTPVVKTDGLPQLICNVCCHLLRKHAEFRMRSRAAQFYLQDARAQSNLLKITTQYIRNLNTNHLKLNLMKTNIQILETSRKYDHNKTNNAIIKTEEIDLTIDEDSIVEPQLEINDANERSDLDTKDVIIKREDNITHVNEYVYFNEKVIPSPMPATKTTEKKAVEVVSITDVSEIQANVLKVEIHSDDSSDADLPDCLVGINSDVYKKDTKKQFSAFAGGDFTKLEAEKKKKHENSVKIKKRALEVDLDSSDDLTDDSETLSDTKKRLKALQDDDNSFKSDNLSSDTSEPLPVKKVRKKKVTKAVKVKKVKEGKVQKEKVDKRFKFANEENLANFSNAYNVEIVVLSAEQQIAEIQARKDSDNYKYSVYKCDLCFKGYSNKIAYENHMAVHDPKTGNEVCPICHFRFPATKGLRRHHENHKYNFICKQCNHISKLMLQAKQHYNWHNGFKYVCKHCGKQFDKCTSRLSHVRIHHGSKACQLCGEPFIGDHGLRAHMLKAHKEALHARCLSCGQQFHHAAALRRHQRAAVDDICDSTVRSCPRCGENFTTEDELNRHKQEQHEEVEYTCEMCNKRLKSKKLYMKHECKATKRLRPAASAARKPRAASICEVCGGKYKNDTLLAYHQRVHTGEKPYLCPVCPKSFRMPTLLQYHMHVHTGAKPYKCSSCPKSFKSPTARHIHRLVHTKEMRCPCPLCGKLYRSNTYVKIHIRTAHLKEAWPKRDRRRAGKREHDNDAPSS